MAANGITFDNVWATPSCTTTRASLLTGKHGVNNGVISTPGILPEGVGTIQQYLKQNIPDYQTAAFGKWHVAGPNPDPNHPSTIGVDYYKGNLVGNLTDYNRWMVTTNGVQEEINQYHTSAIVDFAIDWIGEQESPWFTWLAFAAPHTPFHAPPAEFNQRGLSGTAEDIDANTREYYLAAIETMDAELGRLLDSLESDVRENTIVMVVGDNGTPRAVIDQTAFIRSHAKGSLFEGGIHVPMVVSGFGVDRTNVRESGFVSIVDFFPTIIELAGGDDLPEIDGESFLSSLSVPDAMTRQYLYTEFVSDNPLGSGWTVRSETHKYFQYTDGTEALYNLVEDPDEVIDLLTVIGDSAEILSIKEALRAFGLDVRNETL